MHKGIGWFIVSVFAIIWSLLNVFLIIGMCIICVRDGIQKRNWQWRVLGDYVQFWMDTYRDIYHLIIK